MEAPSTFSSWFHFFSSPFALDTLHIPVGLNVSYLLGAPPICVEIGITFLWLKTIICKSWFCCTFQVNQHPRLFQVFTFSQISQMISIILGNGISYTKMFKIISMMSYLFINSSYNINGQNISNWKQK